MKTLKQLRFARLEPETAQITESNTEDLIRQRIIGITEDLESAKTGLVMARSGLNNSKQR